VKCEVLTAVLQRIQVFWGVMLGHRLLTFWSTAVPSTSGVKQFIKPGTAWTLNLCYFKT